MFIIKMREQDKLRFLGVEIATKERRLKRRRRDKFLVSKIQTTNPHIQTFGHFGKFVGITNSRADAIFPVALFTQVTEKSENDRKGLIQMVNNLVVRVLGNIDLTLQISKLDKSNRNIQASSDAPYASNDN